ncbi:MAG: hypothetical protein FWD38_06145 [Oscillospiraceae bacterium]|nr:hypothetical protein [Oscillospiraceae bacterium]
MGKNLNHYQIDTKRKAVSYSYSYEPRPITQNLEKLKVIDIDIDNSDFPEWMRNLLLLPEEIPTQ